jgi:hypothetical protein
MTRIIACRSRAPLLRSQLLKVQVLTNGSRVD